MKNEQMKFCSNCMSNQPEESGVWKFYPTGKRWRCAECSARVKKWKEERMQTQNKQSGVMQ